MHRSEYVMTYLHPRDFDPDQPMIEGLSAIRRFKSYYGLGSSMDKLERLIQEYKFISLNEADRLIDWEQAKVIKFER